MANQCRLPSRLRRKLRLMDLKDLSAKSRPLGKTAYTMRAKRVIKSQQTTITARLEEGVVWKSGLFNHGG